MSLSLCLSLSVSSLLALSPSLSLSLCLSLLLALALPLSPSRSRSGSLYLSLSLSFSLLLPLSIPSLYPSPSLALCTQFAPKRVNTNRVRTHRCTISHIQRHTSNNATTIHIFATPNINYHAPQHQALHINKRNTRKQILKVQGPSQAPNTKFDHSNIMQQPKPRSSSQSNSST